MAKATVRTESVPKITGVTLELSQEEAETLSAIGEFVGGDVKHSRRKHMDSINNALRSVGIAHGVDDSDPGTGTIYFKDSK